ncbi:hypothetical protein CBR_g9031 [Chara braunii]|uniref:NADH dehydrogenase [ubiquinone] 1 alpha subcomplex subunit 13 n=1 Tax=Chara braunii TaxID=69332 RepID=A0A388KNK5_CHABU|nr:hypothetical protein CBR_g9031 [Chara braunii]|eukprot:GBG71615.1 hypothetical protein CBR_g9031 [Chara braunii]
MTEASLRGSKGIASVKDLPVLQDGPPPGGFPAIRYARKIPNTGPSGVVVFSIAAAVISYGMYQVGQGNLHRRALKKEKMEARMAILPLIQAEEDVRYAKARQKALAEEEKIMQNVPGWKVGESVYNSGRWAPPATGRLILGTN